jgi:CRP-like cAMP-binding protein
VTLRLPGERAIEFAEVGPGETLGELPLIDGGPHSATAQVTESGSLLFFRRSDFAPFVSREDPSAYALNRRLAAVTAGRLRRQLQSLAASLERGSARSREAAPAHTPDRLAPATPPDGAYVRRMATFRAVDAAALDRFLAAGRYVKSERGWTLEQEGAPAAAFYLVINGTVERVLIRDDRRIRVGLAGPGQAFGYEGLLDGAPSPATAIARERALLLALPEEAFARLYGTESSESLTFLDVINRDLAGWLRRAVRPQAHLAVRPIA